jgi:hypothetical protein
MQGPVAVASGSSVWGRSPKALLAVEVLALAVFVAFAVALLRTRTESTVVPIDVQAIRAGTQRERWLGIFFQEQHVGYTVSKVTEVEGGGTLYEQRSLFRVATLGKLQEVVTAGHALVDGGGVLQQFDFFMAADPVRLSARGEVRGSEIVMSVDQGGKTSELTFPVSAPPQVGVSLEARIRAEPLSVGKRFSVPYFDPVTMSEGAMEITVTDVEVLANAEEAYWLETKFADVVTRQLVLPTGETLREESPLGLATVRMSQEAATDLPADAGEVDLISLSAAPLAGAYDFDARELRRLTVDVEGVDPSHVKDDPPHQTVIGTRVTIDVPLADELPSAIPVADWTQKEFVSPTMTLPSEDDEIVDKAKEIAGDATDRLTAVRRLNEWVFEKLEKVPTFSVPNGLEVLHTMQGDCNEHTALFVSLARALGIPSRIAAGVVFSDRVTGTGAFYYHAWPEVLLGDPVGWVAVDPTFGELPADATHIKLAEGDLDKQIEIMGVMGKLKFRFVEAR